jgi:hypothetical protein
VALDLDFLLAYMPEKRIARSASGTLSGHAAGEPFDKFVEVRIVEEYPDRTFRQAELLNVVFADHPAAVSQAQRNALLGPPALNGLLSRGRQATILWAPDRPFVEKQNDTADVIVLEDAGLDLFAGPVHLIDVKTYNITAKGQPPNIISALKLAKMARGMIEEANYTSHDITYVGVDWILDGKELVCQDCSVKELFRTPPEGLYINWSAGLQIQFHVRNLAQDFDGTIQEWLRTYLGHFVASVDRHAIKIVRDWADPYRELASE